MDPDAALTRLRELMEQIDDAPGIDAIALETRVTFDALDAWLTNGGFFPAPWARK